MTRTGTAGRTSISSSWVATYTGRSGGGMMGAAGLEPAAEVVSAGRRGPRGVAPSFPRAISTWGCTTITAGSGAEPGSRRRGIRRVAARAPDGVAPAGREDRVMTDHATTTRGRGARRPLLPTTRIGWWAVGLCLGYFVLMPLWSVLPGGAAAAFLSGLAGGVVAVVAARRHGERSIAVLLAMIPLALVAVFVLGEFLLPH